MASRIVLHIGQQKSGTTYLQHGLAQRAEPAAAAGLRYPVPPTGERHVPNHHQRAFYGLLPGEFGYVSDTHAAQARTDWEWLAEQVRAEPGPVLLSSEALAFLRPSAVRRVVDELGVSDVSVLVTARDLARNLGSAWQQTVRGGTAVTFEEFLEVRSRDRDRLAEADAADAVSAPWRAYDLASLFERWGAVVGSDRVTLVTSGAGAPDVLWRRYLEATGVPGLAGLPTPVLTVQQAHLGLTWPETVLLSELNTAIDAAGIGLRNSRVLREAVVVDGFLAAGERGRKVGLPATWAQQVAEWASADVAALRQAGVRVVGDLDDLTPTSRDSVAPSGEEVARAASAAVLAAGRAKLFTRVTPVVLTPRQRAERFVRRRLLRQPPRSWAPPADGPTA
ncbi:hypothetical protein CLV35_1925 [Motilibacter peucedani]|uniref:Sulfotransferase family protein n=1 Tax=Motilibacter peucedani TaxID=598650 RepID=A0A420XQ88_9ACTN|nr:hypothetical protein [Motilibacter peucedani]RKS75458.1 hypothetical protein CLV35_1925 [Motilibacter peucedani]